VTILLPPRHSTWLLVAQLLRPVLHQQLNLLRGLTYLVDNQGDIQFPIIGILHVDGLTKFELAKLLGSKLETTYVNAGLL
jgi:protein involved in polysaccharide export with SLBB domain